MGKYCFGIDIGGTTVKLGLFEGTDRLLEKWEIPTRTEDQGSHILPDIAASIEEKLTEKQLKKEDLIGIGLDTPGPVEKNGFIHRAVNLNWEEFNLEEKLTALTGLKVKAGNDATVAALGELHAGGMEGYQDVVLVTLGTGIGGGIVTGGQLLYGSKGGGAEIGHMHINDDETECCGCGNKGCFEQYGSATGLVRLAKKKLSESRADSVLRKNEVTAKAVFDAVKEQDPLAMEIAEEYGRYLGKGLAMIAAVVDPQAFIIGGGVSKAGDILLSYIKKYYGQYAFHINRDVDFRLARLGNDAGIYGAARLLSGEN